MNRKCQTVRNGVQKERENRMAESKRRGHPLYEYDLYQHGEYIGRYFAHELMEMLGASRAVIKDLTRTGRRTKDGYEIMNAKPPGWEESWEAACRRLRRQE